MKTFFGILTFLSITGVVLLVYFGAFFDLLPVEERILETINIDGKTYSYELIEVASGATSVDHIKLICANRNKENHLLGIRKMYGVPDRIELFELQDSILVTLIYSGFRSRVDTLMFSYDGSVLKE